MSPSDNLKHIYGTYFKSVFESLSLIQYETETFPTHGAVMRFQNDFFRLEMMNYHHIVEISLAPGSDGVFINIEFYYKLIALSGSQSITHAERKVIIGTRLDYVQQAGFLLDQYEKLKVLLHPKNYSSTLIEMTKIHT